VNRIRSTVRTFSAWAENLERPYEGRGRCAETLSRTVPDAPSIHHRRDRRFGPGRLGRGRAGRLHYSADGTRDFGSLKHATIEDLCTTLA